MFLTDVVETVKKHILYSVFFLLENRAVYEKTHKNGKYSYDRISLSNLFGGSGETEARSSPSEHKKFLGAL